MSVFIIDALLIISTQTDNQLPLHIFQNMSTNLTFKNKLVATSSLNSLVSIYFKFLFHPRVLS